MTIPELIQTMCAEISNTDLNAIRKARGFSAKETASRNSFASFFVTSVGVAENMAALTPEEVYTLHLLNETGIVDISFFTRLYESGGRYDTYTQRYKPTFDKVKKHLVRRGLVVMAETKLRGDTVHMERWRFALPSEFAPYLPTIPSEHSNQPGIESETVVRAKLLELVGGSPAIPNDPIPITIKHGTIFLKDLPFSLNTFRQWQIDAWQRTLKVFKPTSRTSLDPTTAAVKLLDENDWITPKSLKPVLAIYSYGEKIPPVGNLLNQGWKLGLLSRLDIDHHPHFRLAPKYFPSESDEEYPPTLEWADTRFRSDAIKIDLRLIPLNDFDLLNRLTHLAVESGELLASPSLIKLGRANPALRNVPLSRWLAVNVSAFKNVFETVNALWGKTILHENLLFAKVRDLSLRIQLERDLKEKLLILSENFIAFPQDLLSSVEKTLNKTGFVIKTIES